jgi:hypothetical protein
MAGILRALPLPRDREWLARIAASEDIHSATPRAAIETSNVVPDRCRIQGRVFHPRHEGGRSITFPLDVTDSAIFGACQVQAKVDPAGSGAERQAVEQVCGSGSVSGGM